MKYQLEKDKEKTAPVALHRTITNSAAGLPDKKRPA
jgi:hypothetical protein